MFPLDWEKFHKPCCCKNMIRHNTTTTSTSSEYLKSNSAKLIKKLLRSK